MSKINGGTIYAEGNAVSAITSKGSILMEGGSVKATGMEVPAMIINDRTMVPLRYISEALGCEVVWNPDTQTIDIVK
jgi:hypothetical protein